MTEAGAGSNTHRPDIEATTEANCPRGGDSDPGPSHRCRCRSRGGCPVLGVVLRLTILEVVASITSEAVYAE